MFAPHTIMKLYCMLMAFLLSFSKLFICIKSLVPSEKFSSDAKLFQSLYLALQCIYLLFYHFLRQMNYAIFQTLVCLLTSL